MKDATSVRDVSNILEAAESHANDLTSALDSALEEAIAEARNDENLAGKTNRLENLDEYRSEIEGRLNKQFADGTAATELAALGASTSLAIVAAEAYFAGKLRKAETNEAVDDVLKDVFYEFNNEARERSNTLDRIVENFRLIIQFAEGQSVREADRLAAELSSSIQEDVDYASEAAILAADDRKAEIEQEFAN